MQKNFRLVNTEFTYKHKSEISIDFQKPFIYLAGYRMYVIVNKCHGNHFSFSLEKEKSKIDWNSHSLIVFFSILHGDCVYSGLVYTRTTRIWIYES